MSYCLLDALPNSDQTALILKSDHGQLIKVSYKDLHHTAQAHRTRHPELQNQSVSITFEQLDHFIIQLLAYDGFCSQLYLQPEQPLALPAEPGTERSETLWYMATSGTTGTPKWIAHRFAGLSRAVKRSPADSLRWGLCYQPYRFAGLQVLLQSLLSGACLIDASQGDAEERVQTLSQHQVTALSATPSLWRQLLMTNELASVPLQQLTLGGEIADQTLLSQLKQLFPIARLLHIYASTEAGVGFAVSDGLAGFPADWLQQKRSGVQLRINEQQHLCIKPDIMPLLDSSIELDDYGFIDTGDVVQLHAGRVHFLGRANGVINVGGNKVHPEQVEQVLLQSDAVLQARVYGKASSVLGQLVVADVVIATGSIPEAVQSELMQLCLQQLQRYQIPTRFQWVSQLTNNSTGKLSRKESNV